MRVSVELLSYDLCDKDKSVVFTVRVAFPHIDPETRTSIIGIDSSEGLCVEIYANGLG